MEIFVTIWLSPVSKAAAKGASEKIKEEEIVSVYTNSEWWCNSILMNIGQDIGVRVDSWIDNYLCNQCLSPLKLWVRISLMASCTPYNIMVFSGFLHQ